MNKPTKKYILWMLNDATGYTPHEFDTVEEALLETKYSTDWYLTSSINDISAYANKRKCRKATFAAQSGLIALK